MACVSAAGQPVLTATYIGPNNGAWNNPANWSTGTVPRNSTTARYNVIIPASRTLGIFLPGETTEIDSLQTGASSDLSVASSLHVLGNSSINGSVTTFNAATNFRLLGTGTQFTRNGGVRTAAQNSSIHIGSSVLDWTVQPTPVSTAARGINADAGFSAIELPNLTILNAAFVDNNASVNTVLGVNVNPNATLAMPRLSELRASTQRGDRFQLMIRGTLIAPNLATITGNTSWNMSTSLTLPLLTQLSNAEIGVNQGGSLSLPAVTSLSNVMIGASTGSGGFSAPLATTYSWEAPLRQPSSPLPVLSAIGNGTVINLSSVASMDFSQDLGGASIDVRTGAMLNLSQLQVITGPAQGRPAFEMHLGHPGSGTVLVPNLATITGSVLLQFYESGASAGRVPALTRFNGGALEVENGSTFESNILTNADDTILRASGQSRIRLPLTLHSARGIRLSNQSVSVIDAEDMSEVHLPSLHTLDASFDVGAPPGGQVNQLVRSSHGSIIRMPALGTIIPPVRPENALRFVVENGGRIEMPGITVPDRVELVVTEGTLAFGGSVAITSGASLFSPGSQRPDRTFMTVRGNLTYAITNEQRWGLNTMSLEMSGAGDTKLEVGGQDLGLGGGFPGFSQFANFSIARLQVGAPGVFTRLRLVDEVNNAPGMGAEALYLRYYLSDVQPTSLVILGGSELVIGLIPVYARINGVGVELHSLIPPGSDRVAFDQGWIVIPAPSAGIALLGLSTLALRRRRRSDAGQIDTNSSSAPYTPSISDGCEKRNVFMWLMGGE